MSAGIAVTVTSLGNPLSGIYRLEVTFGKIERVFGLLSKAEKAAPAQLSKEELAAEKYSIGRAWQQTRKLFACGGLRRCWARDWVTSWTVKEAGRRLAKSHYRSTTQCFGSWLKRASLDARPSSVSLLCCVYSLRRLTSRVWPPDEAPFALAVLVFIVGWQIMSLAHELMYQRVVFFVLGLALVGQVGCNCTGSV